MKKLFPIIICLVLLLASCGRSHADTSSALSDIESEIISEVSSETGNSSVENSEATSSKEEGYEFKINAKTAVERIEVELPFTADIVEIDSRFLSEKAAVSEDMYDDFYGIMSYEMADDSLIAVFCCKTADGVLKLKQQLNSALANENQLAYLNPNANIISADGYVVFVVTENNFNEENIISKLIQ